MGEASWRRHRGGGIIEQSSWRRYHGESIREEKQGKQHQGGGTTERASLGGIIEEAA